MLQWHPAFFADVQIEFGEEADKFLMENEHQLGTKPKVIDVLIIKKEAAGLIEKNIGRIFRQYNILEYKGPGDSFSVDDFYKVLAYALFYKTDTEQINKIDIRDMSITIVSHSYPREMIAHIKQIRGYKLELIEPGIYYVEGWMFPIQLVVTRMLQEDKNFWLYHLTNRIRDERTAEKIIREYWKHKDSKQYQAVMDTIVRANREKFQEVRGSMCQALEEVLEEVMKEKIEAREAAAMEQGIEQGIRRGREANLLESIRNLMDSMKWSLEQSMNALRIPEQERSKYRTMLKG